MVTEKEIDQVVTELTEQRACGGNKDVRPRKKEKQVKEREERYQGWTNQPTWVMRMFIGNESEEFEKWRGLANEAREGAPGSEQVKSGIWPKEKAAIFNLADVLKEDFEDRQVEADLPEPFDALARSAYEDVDWEELAEWLLSGGD